MPELPFKAGDVCYFVLPVADAKRAQAFYGGLLDWRFTPGNVPTDGGRFSRCRDDQGATFGLWAPSS